MIATLLRDAAGNRTSHLVTVISTLRIAGSLRHCPSLGIGALCIVLGTAARCDQALAGTVPVYFSDTQQTFDASLGLNGNLSAVGSGAFYNPLAKATESFVLTPPTDHPLGLVGGSVGVSSHPASVGSATFGVSGDQINAINDLNLNLLNGQVAPLVLETITITTSSGISILKSVDINAAGTLSALIFQQTGSATLLATGPGTGTYSVPGNLDAAVPDLAVTALGLLGVPVPLQTLRAAQPLTGAYTVWGPDNDPHIALDGSLNFSLPLGLSTDLTASITAPVLLTVSSRVDLAASVMISLSYHLEQTGVPSQVPGAVGSFANGSIVTFDVSGAPMFAPLVPEPGSVVLLGIGLAGLGLYGWRRRRAV